MQTEGQKRKKRKKVLKVLAALMGVFLLIGCCSIGRLMFLGSESTATPIPVVVTTTAATTTPMPMSTSTPTPMQIPTATPTPIPTVMVMLEGVYAPGAYIVGEDLQPGTYRGQAGADFCYWARLSALDGELDSIIANDNATGQFYVEVKESDFAFETACRIERMAD